MSARWQVPPRLGREDVERQGYGACARALGLHGGAWFGGRLVGRHGALQLRLTCGATTRAQAQGRQRDSHPPSMKEGRSAEARKDVEEGRGWRTHSAPSTHGYKTQGTHGIEGGGSLRTH